MRTKQANLLAVILILLGIATYAYYIEKAEPIERPPQMSPSPTEKPTTDARTPGVKMPSPGVDTRQRVGKPATGVKRPGPEAVVVKILDQPLPADKSAMEEFLFGTFANKPGEGQFGSYTTAGWQTNFEAFSAAMVQKAEKQKLDAGSLEKVLDLIREDSKNQLAYLPVGAYQANFNDKPVWIVTVKWESAEGMGEGSNLGHIRIFVFDQQTLNQVGFSTCG